MTAKTARQRRAIYQPGQDGEPEPVRRLVAYRDHQLSPKDRVLVSQHKQLGVLRQLGTQQHRWDGQQLPSHLVQQRHDHPDMLSTHWYPSLHQRRRLFKRHRVGRELSVG